MARDNVMYGLVVAEFAMGRALPIVFKVLEKMIGDKVCPQDAGSECELSPAEMSVALAVTGISFAGLAVNAWMICRAANGVYDWYNGNNKDAAQIVGADAHTHHD